jgi:hypothetical protein
LDAVFSAERIFAERETNNTVRSACNICSSPEKTSIGKGAKNTIANRIIKIKRGGKEYFLKRRYTVIRRSVPNIRLNINGANSFNPIKK